MILSPISGRCFSTLPKYSYPDTPTPPSPPPTPFDIKPGKIFVSQYPYEGCVYTYDNTKPHSPTTEELRTALGECMILQTYQGITYNRSKNKRRREDYIDGDDLLATTFGPATECEGVPPPTSPVSEYPNPFKCARLWKTPPVLSSPMCNGPQPINAPDSRWLITQSQLLSLPTERPKEGPLATLYHKSQAKSVRRLYAKGKKFSYFAHRQARWAYDFITDVYAFMRTNQTEWKWQDRFFPTKKSKPDAPTAVMRAFKCSNGEIHVWVEDLVDGPPLRII